MEVARGRESEPARVIDLRSKRQNHHPRLSLQVAIRLITAAQRALEAIDGKLAGHDALEV